METTPAQIAQDYLACTHSVDLINTLKAKAVRTAEDDASIERNEAHIRLMCAKDCWTTEDMTSLHACLA